VTGAPFAIDRSVTGQPWRWRRPPDDSLGMDALVDELLLARGVEREDLPRHRDPRIAVSRQVVALDASGEKQLVDQRVHAQAVVGRPPPPPRLPAHRSIDGEGGAGHPISRA